MAQPILPTLRKRFQRLCITEAIALVLAITLATTLAVQSATAASLSPVKGLIALKSLAQQSVPYDLAMANGKPTLLEFYADWCSSCQSMAPVMRELHGHYGDRINFVMVNIDEAQAAAAVKQYAVTGIPHLLTLTSTGEVMEQFVGRVPGKLLDQAIALLVEESESIVQSLSNPNLS